MTDEKNRRRFFRITDAIHVAYEIIDEAATLETFAADHNETMIDAVAFLNQQK